VAPFNLAMRKATCKDCHSRFKPRVSLTSCSICRLAFFGCLVWGVEMQAAVTKTDSRVLTKLSISLRKRL